MTQTHTVSSVVFSVPDHKLRGACQSSHLVNEPSGHKVPETYPRAAACPYPDKTRLLRYRLCCQIRFRRACGWESGRAGEEPCSSPDVLIPLQTD